MIAPQFVKPFVKSNKNDAVDAEAICEAIQRPSMRFVPSKTVEQQETYKVYIVFVVKRLPEEPPNQIKYEVYS